MGRQKLYQQLVTDNTSVKPCTNFGLEVINSNSAQLKGKLGPTFTFTDCVNVTLNLSILIVFLKLSA